MAHFDLLAETARWHRVAHAAPLDLGDGHVHPPGLDDRRCRTAGEAAAPSIGASISESLGRDLSHAAVESAVDAARRSSSAARSLSSATLFGAPVARALFEEPLLHVTEGAFDLALALGVPGLAGPDLGAVELGEASRRRVEA